jgi:phosphomannomutase
VVDQCRLALFVKTVKCLEEYTLVACADYVLSKTLEIRFRTCLLPVLRDVTNLHKGSYEASAVGEVNVVDLMKKNNAIIGGEGMAESFTRVALWS